MVLHILFEYLGDHCQGFYTIYFNFKQENTTLKRVIFKSNKRRWLDVDLLKTKLCIFQMYSTLSTATTTFILPVPVNFIEIAVSPPNRLKLMPICAKYFPSKLLLNKHNI